MVGKQIDYAPNRGDDGSLLLTVGIQANGFGLDWCRQLTAGKRTDTPAPTGPSIDTLASVALGVPAYLQVFRFPGTSVNDTLNASAVTYACAAITSAAFTA